MQQIESNRANAQQIDLIISAGSPCSRLDPCTANAQPKIPHKHMQPIDVNGGDGD